MDFCSLSVSVSVSVSLFAVGGSGLLICWELNCLDLAHWIDMPRPHHPMLFPGPVIFIAVYLLFLRLIISLLIFVLKIKNSPSFLPTLCFLYLAFFLTLVLGKVKALLQFRFPLVVQCWLVTQSDYWRTSWLSRR